MAQLAFGTMYSEGLGVPQDYTKAAVWFWRATEQGVTSAQSGLGAMYYEGHGVRQDYIEALKWTRRAAE